MNPNSRRFEASDELVACATIMWEVDAVPSVDSRDVEAFRRSMHQLVRRFGSLVADGTPCGKPLSLVHAHSLMVLLTRGEISQQALGAELCIDKSNVARVCARMVDAGHVRQRSSEHDARSRLVSLTARGERLAREVDASSAARFEGLLARLPPGRTHDVIEAVECVVAALQSPVSGSDLENAS
jgi:DNA-binding MarR family transcriptional regulator